eukprot:TRINITY_DN10290_c0_g1_i1.p1 TRINITY_DN10290_c0_g1~~TRINITY_DN10290_c0_g1_i1.p1  ORF type:complete len:330 (+),score=58.75 TRINITY_DN10290_c0_g1_i1:41-1030(+)
MSHPYHTSYSPSYSQTTPYPSSYSSPPQQHSVPPSSSIFPPPGNAYPSEYNRNLNKSGYHYNQGGHQGGLTPNQGGHQRGLTPNQGRHQGGLAPNQGRPATGSLDAKVSIPSGYPPNYQPDPRPVVSESVSAPIRDVTSLVIELKKIQFEISRVEFIEKHFDAITSLDTRQCRDIIDCFEYNEYKMRIMELLFPFVTDKVNFSSVIDELDFEVDKKVIHKKLSIPYTLNRNLSSSNDSMELSVHSNENLGSVEYQKLSANYEKLRDDYDQLNSLYLTLKQDYDVLQNQLQESVKHNSALRKENARLNEDNTNMERSLRNIYDISNRNLG